MSTNFSKFESFVPYITDTIVEAREDDVIHAIQRAVRKMARDTEFFFEDYTLDVVASTTEYEINSDYEVKNLRVRTITLDDVTVTNAEYTLSTNGSVVTLVNEPTESVTDGLEIRTTILPDLDCLELDEDQLERWAEAVIALSKSELHAQPRKPWTDPMENAVQLNLYEGYVELMAQERTGQGQSGSTTVNFGARV